MWALQLLGGACEGRLAELQRPGAVYTLQSFSPPLSSLGSSMLCLCPPAHFPGGDSMVAMVGPNRFCLPPGPAVSSYHRILYLVKKKKQKTSHCCAALLQPGWWHLCGGSGMPVAMVTQCWPPATRPGALCHLPSGPRGHTVSPAPQPVCGASQPLLRAGLCSARLHYFYEVHFGGFL